MKSVVEGCEDGIDWKSVVCWLVGCDVDRCVWLMMRRWMGEDLVFMLDDARLDGEAASEFDPCC